MFGRLFGRGKDEPQAVCAQCGRPLLPGEWTRRVVDENGEEHLICSQCGGEEPPLDWDESEVLQSTGSMAVPDELSPADEPQHDAPAAQVGPAAAPQVAAVVAQTPDWLAAKDAEIAALRQQLAQSDDRVRALEYELAALRSVAPAAAPAVVSPHGDSSEPGERTWGETPAEFAARLAAILSSDEPQPASQAAIAAEETRAYTPEEAAAAVGPALQAQSAEPEPESEATATEAAPEAAEQGPEVTEEAEPEEAPVEPEPEPESPSESDLEAERLDMPAIALLQRGIDLFNLSPVPHKIAETTAQLGQPTVHAQPEEPLAILTFMWSMGWYRFTVDTETREVTLAERGYDELTELASNVTMRSDGTIELVVTDVVVKEPPAAEAPAGEPAAAPQPSAEEQPKQPSDWEDRKARDFDWNK